MLLLSMLLIKSSYSQTAFIIDSVRYTCLKEQELDSVLVTYFRLDECKEISDTLQSEINLLRLEIRALESVSSIHRADSLVMEEMITTLTEQKADLKKAIKKENRKKFWSGFVWGGLTLAAIETVAVILIVLR